MDELLQQNTGSVESRSIAVDNNEKAFFSFRYQLFRFMGYCYDHGMFHRSFHPAAGTHIKTITRSFSIQPLPGNAEQFPGPFHMIPMPDRTGTPPADRSCRKFRTGCPATVVRT